MSSYLFSQCTSICFCLWYFISTCLSQHFISALFSWISDMELLPLFTSFHFIISFLLFFYSLSYSSFQLFFSLLSLSSFHSAVYLYFFFLLNTLFLSWLLSFLFPLATQTDISHLCFLFFPLHHLFDFIPIEISSSVPKWRGTHKQMVENWITEKGEKGQTMKNKKVWWFTGKDNPFGG